MDWTNRKFNLLIEKVMIARKISNYICDVSRSFPVIAIMGPRQSGKTTLAKELFPGYEYVNFENPEIRACAAKDLVEFMRKHAPPVIFDEVQCYPIVLQMIQCWVDEHNHPPASYILTGSNQPHLRGVISESLAGRIAITYLLPLSFDEFRMESSFDRAESILHGFMPRMFTAPSVTPQIFYENYVTTYVEKDVNQLINLKDTERFTALLRLLSARVGQLLNYASLANEIGVSAMTIQDWITVMEASFIVFRVYPYFNNFGKRFVKTPKLYFTDVGLAAHLLDLHTSKEVERDPLFGNLFENMVVANIRKNQFNVGNMRMGTAGMYFLRDKTGNEVDVALEVGGRKLDLIEIKSSMTYNTDFTKSIEKYAKIIGDGFNHGQVIYAGSKAGYHGIDFVNFADT